MRPHQAQHLAHTGWVRMTAQNPPATITRYHLSGQVIEVSLQQGDNFIALYLLLIQFLVCQTSCYLARYKPFEVLENTQFLFYKNPFLQNIFFGRLWDRVYRVYIYILAKNLQEQHFLRAKPMLLVPIALIVVVIGPVQFIEQVALSCVCIDNILNSIINKLQCSMLHVKRAKNGVLFG